MIRLENLTYTYPDEKRPVLRGLNLEIPRGQFCAIVGANGAGKSTLCYVLSGLVPRFFRGDVRGHVRVAGYDVLISPPSELAGKIGFVFDNPFNQVTGARFTVREEIAFGLENIGVPRSEMPARIDSVLGLTGLGALADRSPFSLSGGQQQRLAIASVLVLRPEVLVLDEPTSQLDPAGTKQLFRSLVSLAREAAVTVVIAEHKVDRLAAFADRVIVLGDGQIAADGDPRAVLVSSVSVDLGVEQTSLTRAARAARRRRLVSSRRELPVTLEQAVAYFR